MPFSSSLRFQRFFFLGGFVPCQLLRLLPQGFHQSQESTRNKETTTSTADGLQWAIGEGTGDHISLNDSQGESQAGKVNGNLCALCLSTQGTMLKDFVPAKNVKQPDGSYARKCGAHARKAAVSKVVPPEVAEDHLNNRPLSLSMFLPHNLNLQQQLYLDSQSHEVLKLSLRFEMLL